MATTPLIRKIKNSNGVFYAFQSAINDTDLCNCQNSYRFQFSKYALINIPNIKTPSIDIDGDVLNCGDLKLVNENATKSDLANGDPVGSVYKMSDSNTEEETEIPVYEIDDIIVKCNTSLKVIPGGIFDFSKIENTIQFNALGNSVIGENDAEESASTDMNSKYLAESFQNYCLNLESVLLSQSNYSSEVGKRTVAERVFFKWLKELGAIRFKEIDDERYYTKEVDDDAYSRFIEENVNLDTKYRRVVQYINDIQAVYGNSDQIVSTEVQIYIPTEQGSSPYVLFKSVEDDNYHSYTNDGTDNFNEYTVPYPNATTDNCLCGRVNNNHPEDLNTYPYYDNDADSNNVTQKVVMSDGPLTKNYWWYSDSTANAYYTDNSNKFHTAQNLLINKYADNRNVSYARTTLDGICIDFDAANYNVINKSSATAITLNDLNTDDTSRSFDFNAILLYYDLINDSTGESVTNLYGVYFISDLSAAADYNLVINRDTKSKPTQTDNGFLNGNSLAYKINFKTDSSFENITLAPTFHTQTSGNYNTYSMDLFVDAITSIRTIARSYEENLDYIKNAYEEINSMKNVILNTDNILDINKRIDKINDTLAASSEYIGKSKTFLDMVDSIYDDYDEIVTAIKNNSTIKWKYDVDPGVINSVVDHNQNYNIDSNNYKFDFTSPENGEDSYVVNLNKYSNYIKHVASNSDDDAISIMSKDITIMIDDSKNQWTPGQTMRIVFETPVDFGGYTISLVTDALGKETGTQYDNEIYKIASPSGDIISPIYEIIYVGKFDENESGVERMHFEVDRIK